MQSSPLKTALLKSYTLLEVAHNSSRNYEDIIKIPSEYRSVIAEQIKEAIQQGKISDHAKTGSARYDTEGISEFSVTHKLAEDSIKQFQDGQISLNIVPIYYSDHRYVACAELPHQEMLILVTDDAPYPPEEHTHLTILTHFAVCTENHKALVRHLMEHPDEVTEDEPELWNAYREDIRKIRRENKPTPTQEQIQKQLDDIMANIERLRASITMHKKEYDNVANALAQKQASLTALSTKEADLRKQINQHKTILGQLNKQNVDVQQQRSKQQKSIDSSTATAQQLKSKIDKEQQKLANHSKNYNQIKEKFIKQFNTEPIEHTATTESAAASQLPQIESISIPESLCREAHEYISTVKGWRPDQAKRLYPANRDWLQSNASTFLRAYDITGDVGYAVSAINQVNGHPVNRKF